MTLLSYLIISQAQAEGTYYLLRHAEKHNDATRNPHLNERGMERARNLAHQLSSAKITKIYSTDYHRTQETAKPLSELLGIPVESYDPNKLDKFADSLRAEEGRIVIVGHSNTTPALVGLLSGRPVETMSENEYDDVYQVVLLGGKTQLARFKSFPPN